MTAAASRLVALAKQARHDRHATLFICEGVRLVEELLRSPLRDTHVLGVLYEPGLLQSERGLALLQACGSAASIRAAPAQSPASRRPVETACVRPRVLEQLADTVTPQSVLAIARIPSRSLPPDDLKCVPERAHTRWSQRVELLVLDGVSDPGNVGTLLRTAVAFDVRATVAMPGTAHLWSPKVLRSGMGAHFRHHCLAVDGWAALDAAVSRLQLPVFAADGPWATDGAAAAVDVGNRDAVSVLPPHLALIVGSEGAGLSAEARQRTTGRRLTVPMANGVESLNVAVASGVLLFALATAGAAAPAAIA